MGQPDGRIEIARDRGLQLGDARVDPGGPRPQPEVVDQDRDRPQLGPDSLDRRPAAFLGEEVGGDTGSAQFFRHPLDIGPGAGGDADPGSLRGQGARDPEADAAGAGTHQRDPTRDAEVHSGEC